ncbi:MAG TPA: type II toxin-antitoxin system RelE/ParE family toxin [Tepidisphaeraceae bacterium]|jgi:toxin ParE1/3/4|nr:type II toxin-antitoxin system RelE/ParE family toxin [Tepidisphaeraceae bacterium]
MSAPRILLRQAADEEIDEAARYIAERNLEPGKAFYDAIEAAFGYLAAHPGAGARRPNRNRRLADLRSWPIKGYENYVVFYLPLRDGGIDVLHVLHGARNIDRILERG